LREQDPADAPTFFDVTTAAALLLFREARVDRAVLEVGLGGRLDSTNVVDPAVCCITTIELEHTDRLGDSLAAIAGEKAGILKPGVPAVCGALPAEAAAVVAARARELGAPLARIGDEIELRVQSRGADGSTLELRDGDLALTLDLPLLGEHQATNAALALACVRRLPGGPEGPALCEAAAKGLAALRLPGRLELVGRAPWVVIDAAHTPASAEALARALDALPRRRARLVLSVSAGKDLDAILAALLPRFDEVTVTRAEATRSLGAGDVARAVRAAAPGVSLRAVPNPFLAVRAAREGLGAGDLLCVAGSVYLAGIARRVLR
jgi:dihydrofolate synthase/folylpolyglutamate synthase